MSSPHPSCANQPGAHITEDLLGVIYTFCVTHNLPSNPLMCLHVLTLSAAAAFHFKYTRESTHARPWPCITATLFDVTLPKDIHSWAVKKKKKKKNPNSFLPSQPRVMPAFMQVKSWANAKKNNNKTQLINLDLPTQRSFVCVCRAPRLALMKHIDREHMPEKAAERCLITVAGLKPYIRTPVALRRRYALAFFTGASPSFVLLHA